jgi:hypothetical protein
MDSYIIEMILTFINPGYFDLLSTAIHISGIKLTMVAKKKTPVPREKKEIHIHTRPELMRGI